MFWNNSKYQAKYYNLIDRAENFEKRIKLLPVNFEKPWWDIIFQQKAATIYIFSVQFIWSVFDALFPIMLGFAVTELSLTLFLAVILARLILSLFYSAMFSYNTVFQIQTINSVEYSANEFFLTVDPLFHSTKSSGQIVSKVNRGSSSFESVMDIITFDMIGIVTGITTIIITMFAFDFRLGLISLFFLSAMTIFNIFGQIFNSRTFQPLRIAAEDKFKAVSLETLLQAPFIRAIFASNEQTRKSKIAIKNSMIKEGNAWQAETHINTATRAFYIISVAIIGYLILIQAQNGILAPALAFSIIITYTNGTQNILYVGNKVKRLTTSLSNINDLFDFIRGFGKQSFPVLDDDKQWQSANTPKTIPS